MFPGLPVEVIAFLKLRSALGGKYVQVELGFPPTKWFYVSGMHEAQEINSQLTKPFQPLGSSNRWQLLCRVLRTYGHRKHSVNSVSTLLLLL